MIVSACVSGPLLAQKRFVRQFDTWLPGPMNVLKQQQQQHQINPRKKKKKKYLQKAGINVELSAIGGNDGGGSNNNNNNAVFVMNNTNNNSAQQHDDIPNGNNNTNNSDTRINTSTTSNSSHDNGGESYESSMDGSGIRYETMDDQRSSSQDYQYYVTRKKWKLLKRIGCVTFLSFFVLLVIPLFVTIVAIPDKLYVESFYTGCKSFYTTDLEELVSSSSSFFSNSNEDDDEDGGGQRRSLLKKPSPSSQLFVRRWLAGDDDDNNGGGGGGDYACAEFCLPHIVVPVFRHVTRKKKIPIYLGRCSDQVDQDGDNSGLYYTTHILDKTFSAFSYSLDVELYGTGSS